MLCLTQSDDVFYKLDRRVALGSFDSLCSFKKRGRFDAAVKICIAKLYIRTQEDDGLVSGFGIRNTDKRAGKGLRIAVAGVGENRFFNRSVYLFVSDTGGKGFFKLTDLGKGEVFLNG